VIEKWHDTTNELPAPQLDIDHVLYALWNPLSPHQDAVVVDLYHRDVIQAYVDGQIACFRLEGGRWNFGGVVTCEKIMTIAEQAHGERRLPRPESKDES